MPTTASMTFSNATVDPYINPDDAMASMVDVKIAASTTLAAGTLVGPVTATPGTYAAYAVGNADGTQIPAGILRRAVVTDSNGLITNQNEWGALGLVTPIYTEGVYLVSELTGLDANAVTVLGGHYIGSAGATRLFSF